MATLTEKEAERAHALATLKTLLPDERVRLYTLTTFGRGETDYVRIFTARAGEIVELTWWLRAAAGMRGRPRMGIAFGGGQYSKALEAVDLLWHTRFGAAFPQDRRWGELPVWEEL